MSSIDSAVWRKRSLTSMPLWPYLLELERRGERGAGLALGRQRCRRAAAWPAYFVEHRLGVERIDVRRAAVHEDVDDALGFGGEVGRVRAAVDRSTAAVAFWAPMIRSPSASAPKPMPQRWSSSRRVRAR